MKGFTRRFATLLAATMVVSGLFFAPVVAEETETTEPVATQEMVEMEESVEASEIITAESNISEDVEAVHWYVHSVYNMDELVQELGASNVSRISDTKVKLLKDIQFPGPDVLSISFNMPELTIDFNGYACEGLISFRVMSGSVTLTDSSGSNSGGVSSSEVVAEGMPTCAPPCVDIYGGSLTIESGKYVGYSFSVYASAGNLSIQGGVFEKAGVDANSFFIAVCPSAKMSSARITGGEFRGDLYAVYCYREPTNEPEKSTRNPLQISGGSFSCSLTGYGAVTYLDRDSDVVPDINELLAEDCYFVPDDTYVRDETDGQYMFTGRNVKVEKPVEITSFVTRLYTMALGRSPDTAGKRDWVTQLMEKKISGSAAAYGFFFSSELTNRNLSNQQFVTLLYNVFLNRDPDAGGLQNWVSALETGASRKYVFAGFANSQEWKGLCAAYEIEPGSFTSDEPRDQNLKVTAFVQRLYTLCLNRSADVIGLNDWTGALVNKTKDGAHVAYGFFFSQEFIGRNLSNVDYVEVLYQVLLGRGSDPVGRANWVAQLEGGKSRLEIFKGFVHSAEFDAICKDYGIVRGEI